MCVIMNEVMAKLSSMSAHKSNIEAGASRKVEVGQRTCY